MSDSRKRPLENENDAAAQRRSPRAIPSCSKLINANAVAQTWSPDFTRLNRREKKVSSLEDSNLRGGNFVLDCDGNATTLSFVFEKEAKLYGLTAGHLADPGDPIFVFLTSSMIPNDFDDGESYEMMEVGEVVSKDVETDSLIFEISNPYMIGKVDPLKLLHGHGFADNDLRLPGQNANDPCEGTKVVLYGTMRRGEVGIVTVPSKQYAGYISKIGDIGIASVENGTRPLTSDGDCGTVYVTEDGLGLAMHHCLKGNVSFGIPIANILAKHSLLGGQAQAAPERQQRMRSSLMYRERCERRNMTKFDTKIKMPPPFGDAHRDKGIIYESRNIAKFSCVRRVKGLST